MPYDLPFERLAELDNESALTLNKAVAAKLIAAFPETHDLNPVGSNGYFMQRELDLDDEVPEKHFCLYAENEDMYFDFQFWKNTLWLDLGANGNIYDRFAHVRRYAAFILQQGFRISSSIDGDAANLDEGIEWHLQEYQKWVGLVDHVMKVVSPEDSSQTD